MSTERPADLEELQNLARRVGVAISAVEDVSVLAEPVKVAGFELPNALAVHPMEGCDGDSEGRPGPLTLRRYDRFASGGAGLIWVEATAVVPEGRANPRQLWLHEKSFDSFARLADRIRRMAAHRHGPGHRPFLVMQLTHSGRYSKPGEKPQPVIAQHDPFRDARMGLPSDWPVASDEYLDRLQGKFLDAARLAFRAGFDAVDIKSCHGYLISELLASQTRPGKYGGPFENRASFLLQVIDRIRGELGADKLVTPRLGIYDAVPFPYGWGVGKDEASRPDLSEPKRLVSLLAGHGVPMINLTAANPYYNPHCNRPYDRPANGGYAPPEHPLVGVARLIDLAGEVQRSVPSVAMVGTGYTWLRTLFPNVAAASRKNGLATLVGAGRLAFAYPDFAADIVQKGKLDPRKVCVTCSACTQIMRDGGTTGCAVRDARIYRPVLDECRARRAGKT